MNFPPTISSFEPTDTTKTIELGDYVKFSHSSSDPDGGSLNSEWFLEGSSVSTNSSWRFTPDDVGNYTIKLVVSDSMTSSALTANKTWQITVTRAKRSRS